MATKKQKRALPKTVAENILAAGLGSSIGYAAGAGASHALVNKGPYAKRLKKLPHAKRLKELKLVRGVVGAGAVGAGGLAGLAARQRLRKARKRDNLTRKLAELR